MRRAALLMVLGTVLLGCGRQEAADETPAIDQPGAPAETAIGDVAITFRSEPEPPVTGENTFEATVEDASGNPVTDATVTAEFFMPAMPEMKMPAMRNSTTLTHDGEGRYRGRGQVMMAGAWDVTVTVRRGEQVLGSRTVPVTAK